VRRSFTVAAVAVACGILSLGLPRLAFAHDFSSACVDSPDPPSCHRLTAIAEHTHAIEEVGNARLQQIYEQLNSGEIQAMITGVYTDGSSSDPLDVRIKDVNIPPGEFDPRPAGALQVFDSTLYAAAEGDEPTNTAGLRLDEDVTARLDAVWVGIFVLAGIIFVRPMSSRLGAEIRGWGGGH
jgi:hypothetical protein